MKVVFVLIAFCVVLVTAIPLVKLDLGGVCTSDTSCDGTDYDVTDLKISISPDSLKPEDYFTITVNGTVNKKITGGNVTMVARYDIVTVFDETIDICEFVRLGGLQCPVHKGRMSGALEAQVPSFAPLGKYHIAINATDQNGKPSICFKAECLISH
ncbi:putative phosphatidylglycerol/phosphatidylinositol transfer protein DDB_G0278295 [Dysidea avara]|uniref:putative phosphatidylglycerol/phosphatidylinositol transfer protein DDB_G0278295 n=1 Tax=Dysidea avara TaxID=196820 RepID=UPI0033314F19